jgi:hypothetical protein
MPFSVQRTTNRDPPCSMWIAAGGIGLLMNREAGMWATRPPILAVEQDSAELALRRSDSGCEAHIKV